MVVGCSTLGSRNWRAAAGRGVPALAARPSSATMSYVMSASVQKLMQHHALQSAATCGNFAKMRLMMVGPKISRVMWANGNDSAGTNAPLRLRFFDRRSWSPEYSSWMRDHSPVVSSSFLTAASTFHFARWSVEPFWML